MIDSAATRPLTPQALDDWRHDLATLLFPALTALGVGSVLLSEARRWPFEADILGLLIALTAIAGYALLTRAYRFGIWFVTLVLIVITVLAVYWFPAQLELSMLALPLALATLLLGPASGLAAAAFCSAIVLFGQTPLAVAPASVASPLIVIWGCAALMSLSLRVVEQTMGSLSASHERMSQLLEQVRDGSVDLKQAQADLVQANTQLARLSDRLNAMYHVAEEARRTKEEFVANVSHELRTPLNMIIGFAQVISTNPDAYETPLPPAALADVDVILRNARHLASLVDDVLDLSQSEAQTSSLRKEPVSLSEIADEAMIAVRPLFESKRLKLTVSIPAHLPPLLCDRTRVRQVLLNLLSNAGRFTNEGGVAVGAELAGNEIVVHVTDSGPGIAREHQQRIFEPFQQADASLHRRHGGTGLGLSISKRFVQMHGGRMWLESAVGVGSTFFFTLPLPLDAAASADNPARWASPDFEYHMRIRQSHIVPPDPQPRYVVLEQGAAVRKLLSHALPNTEIAPVTSIEQALADLRKSGAQALIINDATLLASGSALMQRVAELPYGTPAIVCWAPGQEEAAQRLGVVHYLIKPILRETLCAALEPLAGTGATVLIVDDEPEALQLYTRMLRSVERRYRVLVANNGRRALSLLRERKPDVMLLDLVMPGMDGYSVLADKQRDGAISEIPVIITSAQDPMGSLLLGNVIALARGGGMAARDLITCIRMWGNATVPEKGEGDRG